MWRQTATINARRHQLLLAIFHHVTPRGASRKSIGSPRRSFLLTCSNHSPTASAPALIHRQGVASSPASESSAAVTVDEG
jgi:hypothetical protein